MDETLTSPAPAAPGSPDVDADRPSSGGAWSTVGWIFTSLVICALVVGIWMKVGNDRAGAELVNSISAGDRPKAPALPTERVTDEGAPGLPAWYRADGMHQASSTPGAEVLVVNWWASWCGPCVEEAPELAKIAKDYEGRVVVVGLNAGHQDLESDARAFAREHDIEFPLVRATAADEDAWGVGGFPETFVVGTDGRISSFVNGPVDAEALRELLDDELGRDRA